uniref:Translation initiation factor eIF-2B delta subunit n=1 Tax=Arundo donax TaxID=35708 RepID=A0A0A9F9K0_ARUDO
MVAHAFGIPVLVCCEAYKFHERSNLILYALMSLMIQMSF